MRDDFRNLRLKQLDRASAPFRPAVSVARPVKGWVRAIREAIGVSSAELARRMGTSRQLSLQQEKAEGRGQDHSQESANLGQRALIATWSTLWFREPTSVEDLMSNRARIQAKKNVLGVEHSMALEDQAVGNM